MSRAKNILPAKKMSRKTSILRVLHIYSGGKWTPYNDIGSGKNMPRKTSILSRLHIFDEGKWIPFDDLNKSNQMVSQTDPVPEKTECETLESISENDSETTKPFTSETSSIELHNQSKDEISPIPTLRSQSMVHSKNIDQQTLLAHVMPIIWFILLIIVILSNTDIHQV